MNRIDDTILKPTAAEASSQDFTGEDGLLYCGKCRKPKEAYFLEGKCLFGRDRHPAECDCQRAARQEREAAAESRHRDEVERLKRKGFTDRTMLHWTFENDNGKCPQMKHAAEYAAKWEQMRDGNYGLLLWGKVGTGKSYAAGLYRKCSHRTGGFCLHDELCGDIK